MTDGINVGTGLKQGNKLAPTVFNIAQKYVMRLMSVKPTATILHNSVQFIGYADDMNISFRTKRAISDVCGELKDRAKEVGLILNVAKTKINCRTGDLEREKH